MSNESIAPTTKFSKVQTGPVYHCPECGATATGLIPHNNGGHLAAWGDHIAYLNLPTSCKSADHPARVAVLGTTVTTLVFPYDNGGGKATTEDCIMLIREALTLIVQKTGPAGAPHDPAASVVYRLLAGVLAPERAIGEIRELAHFGMLGALDDEAEYIFQSSVVQ